MGLRDEEPPRGHEHERGRRSGLPREVRRETGDVLPGDGDEFRVPAVHVLAEDLVFDAERVLPADAVLAFPAREARVHDDPLVDLEVRDVVADLHNLSRHVAAEDVRERQLQRRDPRADEEVEVVQRARPHAHEDVLGTDRRLVEVRDVLKDLRAPVGPENHRLHGPADGSSQAL